MTERAGGAAKIEVGEEIPEDLLKFLLYVAEEIQSDDPDSPARVESEDLLRGERVSGGLRDAERQVFAFRYFPSKKPWHWDFELTLGEILLVEDLEGGELALWKCDTDECEHRFGHPDAQCPQHDQGQPLGEEGTGAAPKRPGAAVDETIGATDEAARFIRLLVESERLELVADADEAALAKAFAPKLRAEGPPDEKAETIIDWLVDRDEVEEVFLEEEELAKVLKAW